MAVFDYLAPASLDEALALLAERGPEARPYAGGTDLLVRLRLGQLSARLLVDVKHIPELNRLSYDPGQGLTVGAALPLYRIYECPDIVAHYPALADAASLIGGPAIRGRATLGGNLCHAAPSGDSIPAMMVLQGLCTVAGPRGTRTVPVERFCTGPGQTVLEPGEILVSIGFPPPSPRSGSRYLRFTPRGEMDIAVAGAGALVELGEDGATIRRARIALGAVGPAPILADEAAAALVGRAATAKVLAEAAALAARAAHPITDMRGTAAQRRHLVGVLTSRALAGALERAQGGAGHGQG